MGAYAIDETSKNKRPVYTKEESDAMTFKPNLLINGDFIVNSNGQTSYKGYDNGVANSIDTLDMWKSMGVNVAVMTDYIRVANRDTTYHTFRQTLDNLKDGVYTISMKVLTVEGEVLLNPKSESAGGKRVVTGLNTYTFEVNSSDANAHHKIIMLGLKADALVDIEWIRLDAGTFAVPHMKEDYEIASLRCGASNNLQWFIDNGFLPDPNGAFVYINGAFEDGQSMESGSNNNNVSVSISTLVSCLEITLTKSSATNTDAFGNAIFKNPISLTNYTKLIVEYDVISVSQATYGAMGFFITSDKANPSYSTTNGLSYDGGQVQTKGTTTSYSVKKQAKSGLKLEMDISTKSGSYYFGVFHNSFNGSSHVDKIRINKVYLS